MIQWRQKETEVHVKALESGSAQPPASVPPDTGQALPGLERGLGRK